MLVVKSRENAITYIDSHSFTLIKKIDIVTHKMKYPQISHIMLGVRH